MAKRSHKLYTCCTNPRCEKYQDLREFVHIWGFKEELVTDKDGQYFDVTPPDYWLDNRRMRFAHALKCRVPAKHGRAAKK